MKQCMAIAVFGGLLVLNVAAWGDALLLRGGDRLTGTLEDIIDGAAGFKTELAGLIIVPVDEIRALTTARSFRIALSKGQTLEGRFYTGEDHMLLEPIDGTRAVPINLVDVVSAIPIAPDEEQAIRAAARTSPEWEGSIDAGVLLRSGSSNRSRPFGRLTLDRTGLESDFMAKVLLEYGEHEDYPALFSSLMAWRSLASDPGYPMATFEIERDTAEGIGLRIDLGGGFGTTLVDEANQRFAAAAGLGVTFEYFDAGPVLDAEYGRYAAQLAGRTESAALLRMLSSGALGSFETFKELAYYADEERRYQEQALSGRLQLTYERGWLLDSRLVQDLVVYPQLTALGELHGRSETALRVPVAPALELQLNLRIDFDTEPAFRALDTWRTTLGAGLTWEF